MFRVGYSRTAVSRETGISEPALRSFLRGDPRSSGVQWLALKRRLGEEKAPT